MGLEEADKTLAREVVPITSLIWTPRVKDEIKVGSIEGELCQISRFDLVCLHWEHMFELVAYPYEHCGKAHGIALLHPEDIKYTNGMTAVATHAARIVTNRVDGPLAAGDYVYLSKGLYTNQPSDWRYGDCVGVDDGLYTLNLFFAGGVWSYEQRQS